MRLRSTISGEAAVNVLSVSVSKPQVVEIDGKMVSTGIFKRPVDGPIMLREFDFDGDGQGDLSVHGGPHRAAYVYPSEHYDYWQAELGRDDFSFGLFGENLTLEGLTEDTAHIGDEFKIGGATVVVTQPRVPCFKLAHVIGLPEFPKQFLASGRTGFYLRVVEEGAVTAGDAVELVKPDPEAMSVREVCNLLYFDQKNLDDARRAIGIAALSPGWRGSFEVRLAKAG